MLLICCLDSPAAAVKSLLFLQVLGQLKCSSVGMDAHLLQVATSSRFEVVEHTCGSQFVLTTLLHFSAISVFLVPAVSTAGPEAAVPPDWL